MNTVLAILITSLATISAFAEGDPTTQHTKVDAANIIREFEAKVQSKPGDLLVCSAKREFETQNSGNFEWYIQSLGENLTWQSPPLTFDYTITGSQIVGQDICVFVNRRKIQ